VDAHYTLCETLSQLGDEMTIKVEYPKGYTAPCEKCGKKYPADELEFVKSAKGQQWLCKKCKKK
jgi:hypothetical protein